MSYFADIIYSTLRFIIIYIFFGKRVDVPVVEVEIVRLPWWLVGPDGLFAPMVLMVCLPRWLVGPDGQLPLMVGWPVGPSARRPHLLVDEIERTAAVDVDEVDVDVLHEQLSAPRHHVRVSPTQLQKTALFGKTYIAHIIVISTAHPKENNHKV